MHYGICEMGQLFSCYIFVQGVDQSLRIIHVSMLSWNPLRAKFFRENINIYLHFVSYLHIDTTQVVEILPQIRQEPAYAT